MAERTPTPQDIELPALQGARPIAGYDLSAAARGAATLAKGVETLGAGITKSAEDIAAAHVDQVRQQAVLAQNVGLNKAIALREKYKHDTDYDTLPQRYGDDLHKVFVETTQSIPAGALRDHVAARLQIPLAREAASVSEQAFAGQKGARAAARYTTANAIVDGTGPYDNDPLHTAKMEAHNDSIDEDVRQGFMAPLEAATEKRELALRITDSEYRQKSKQGPAGAEATIRELGGLPAQGDVEGVPGNFLSRIKQSEGFAPRAGWDYRQYTNGYGTKAAAPGEVISQATADSRFADEISKAAKFVDSVNPKLDAGTRAALTSLTFNAGTGWAGAGLGEKIKAGDVDGAQRLFLQYTKAGGQDLAALVTRRNQEAEWFGKANVEAAPPQAHPLVAMLTPSHRDALIAEARAELHRYRTDGDADFARRYQDTVTEAQTIGTATNPLALPDFVGRYGATEGQKHFDDYQANLTLGADMRDVAVMTKPQERKLLEEDYAPQPGEGFAAAAKRQSQLAEAIKRINTERQADPAQFALTRLPAVSDSWNKLATAIHDPTQAANVPALARDYAIKTADEQRRIGIPEESIAIAPKAYIADLNKKITKAVDSDDAQGRTSLIATIQHEAGIWGEAWPTVMRQMAPTAQPVVRAIAAGADPIAMTRLLSLGKDENPGKILKEQSETKFNKVTEALNEEMKPFLGSLVGRQRDRDFGAYYGLGEKLAALYVRDGDDASTAAHKAFNALIGNRYEFRDTWRIPKAAGVPADDVQAGVEDAKLAVRNGALNIRPAINDIGLSDNRADSFSKFAREANG